MANTVDGNVKMEFMPETMSPEFAQSPNPQPLTFFQNAFLTKQDPKMPLDIQERKFQEDCNR